jgi:hypothetical protein
MSYLQYALQILQFETIEEVTTEALKRAFKKNILTAHPDKGGSEERFEALLGAYVYLTETVNRLSGGRTMLQGVLSPEEIQGQRANQMINEVFQEMDNEQTREAMERMRLEYDSFHATFEKKREEESKGYATWLKDGAGDAMDEITDETTKKPSFSQEELNDVFEASMKGKKPTAQAIILHPDDMAYRSGSCLGVSILEEVGGTFTSDLYATPEYTDLYSAYTSDHVMYDKVPVYQDRQARSVEDLLKERDAVYTCQADEDLAAIGAYEKKKMDAEVEHKKRIHAYFNETSSSVWAIHDTQSTIHAVVPNPQQEVDSFVKQF